MSVRRVVTASVAALALAAVSVPMVNAQDGGVGTGALSVEGLGVGSLDGGSLAGPVPQSDSDLVPETDEVCELPDLGGSVAKFYPLFGISGIPAGVINLVTDALDSFPNLIEIVAGEGAGPALLGQTGSMNGALCTSIFGGEMVMPPVTVIVDGDGTPVTTVTGTVSSTRATTRLTSTMTSAPATSNSQSAGLEGRSGLQGGTAQAEGTAGSALDSGPAGGVNAPLPTSVPVPGL